MAHPLHVATGILWQALRESGAPLEREHCVVVYLDAVDFMHVVSSAARALSDSRIGVLDFISPSPDEFTLNGITFRCRSRRN